MTICVAALIITGYIIANVSGKTVQCQNASLSGWTESSYIGQSWTACLKLSNYPEQSQSIQRLFIYLHSHFFFQCSKLGHSWHSNVGGNFLNKREYKLACPSSKNNWTMCMTVYNGSKDDLGYLNFASNDQKGEPMKICSLFLSLKDWAHPQARLVKSDCLDHKNRGYTLELDCEEVKFNASLYYRNILLCNLNRKDEYDMDSIMERKNLSCILYCNVSNDATETVTKMYGKIVTGKGTVEYKSENVQRNITVEQMNKIEKCIEPETYKMDIWIPIVISVVVLMVVLVLLALITRTCCTRYKYKCKSTERSKNDMEIEVEAVNSESVTDQEENGNLLDFEIRPQQCRPEGANEQPVDDPCGKLVNLPLENDNSTDLETNLEIR